MENNHWETIMTLLAEKIEALNVELILCKAENKLLKQTNEELQREIDCMGGTKNEQTFAFGGEA